MTSGGVADGPGAVTVPVGSSSGLMARVGAESSVADVAAATGMAPPPGTVTHPATVTRPRTAAPSASVRDSRGRGRTTRRTGTRPASWLVRAESTVIDSTSGGARAKRRAHIAPNDICGPVVRTYERAATETGSPPVVTFGPERSAGQAAFLVSQKISAISSILPSSWSATFGSHEPLVPAAPASLVASLNSSLRFGYFSKCGGLK